MQQPIFDIMHLDPRTKKLRARLHPSARPIDEPWRWPLPRLAGRNPIVLASVDAERHSVDVGYVAAPYDSELFVPVVAAQAGEVSYATETKDGFALSLVHGDWTTHYAHLSKMFVTRCLPRARRRQFVSGGTVIGYAARSPPHVRFELWQWTDESGFVAVDPIPHLSSWEVASAGNDRRALAQTPENQTNEAA
jgi:murein DD-endopeptidase MepM/ murein hydrolase activator NlpD